MNYLLEIKAFYDWLEVNQLPTSGIALWHALMHIANKSKWQDNFTVAVVVLEVKTGLNKQAVLRARNMLKDKGLIDFQKRGNQAAIYHINSLLQCDFHTTDDTANDTTNDTTDDTANNTASDTANDTISKQNKTKQNDIRNTKELPPETDDDTPKSERPKMDYERIRQYFNTQCTAFPAVREITERRKTALRSFLKKHSKEDLKTLLDTAQQSAFLTGSNDRGWRADFDWILKPANAIKILEGNYSKSAGLSGTAEQKAKKNSFNSYSQRQYDYAAIEKKVREEM
ncbi:MAG: hypothetical protein LKJ75_02440 [Clostridia bacterium]|jgi:hypothetical protein|nr:hypothetical protein [Clostridia bacterium]MCI2014042.1 hypothetical protein [Clostridia bacterium]